MVQKREKKAKKKIEKEEREGGFSSSRPLPSLWLMVHTHWLCVRLSLDVHLSWTMCNQATATAASKFLPYMLLVNALRYAKVMFTNTFTHFCLHKNMTYQFMPPLFMSYILVQVYSHGPMQYIHRLFKLSMVLRLKQPSLIKI